MACQGRIVTDRHSPTHQYDSRSAIYSTDTLSCPVLLLQGDEDKIVPPNQAEMMHDALKAKGIPTALKMYVGVTTAR